MFLHVEEARIAGPYSLLIRFNTGEWRQIDLRPSLVGPVFEPLQDPQEFARVFVNEETGTVEWPNGADFAPEYLLEVGEAAEESLLSATSGLMVAEKRAPYTAD